MKKHIITTIVVLVLVSGSVAEAKGGFWKKMKKALGQTVEAVGGAVVHQALVQSGCSREDASTVIHEVSNSIGLNTTNIDNGIGFVEAKNKNERNNIAADIAINAAQNLTNHTEYLEDVRKVKDAQVNFKENMSNATTYGEKQEAKRTRNEDIAGAISSFAFNIAKNTSKEPELVRDIQRATDATFNYNREMRKASSQEEQHAALGKWVNTSVDVVFNAIERKEEKAAQKKRQNSLEQMPENNMDWIPSNTEDPTQQEPIPSQTSLPASPSNQQIENNVEEISSDTIALTQQEPLQAQTLLQDSTSIQQIEIDSSINANNISAIISETVPQTSKIEKQIENKKTKNDHQTVTPLPMMILKPFQPDRIPKNESRYGSIIRIKWMYIPEFPFNETQLTVEQKVILDEVIRVMHLYDDMTVQIIGHTSSIGGIKENYKKGLERAKAGKAYLLENGITENRISIESHGPMDPISVNDSPESSRRNERIECLLE